MFDNYRIPRENLLNKTGDVTPDGQYESVFSEPTKILGAALESFSAGRIGIMQESSNTLADAIVIAVRYAAVRKQFGPDINGPEIPIIEYQLHVSFNFMFGLFWQSYFLLTIYLLLLFRLAAMASIPISSGGMCVENLCNGINRCIFGYS